MNLISNRQITGNQYFICNCYFVSLPQEREAAEAMWAADGQSVVKKDEEAEGTATRNARSQAPKERSKGRGRVTGGRDELWEPEQTWQTELTDWNILVCFHSNAPVCHPITGPLHQLRTLLWFDFSIFIEAFTLHFAAFLCKAACMLIYCIIVFMMKVSKRTLSIPLVHVNLYFCLSRVTDWFHSPRNFRD